MELISNTGARACEGVFRKWLVSLDSPYGL